VPAAHSVHVRLELAPICAKPASQLQTVSVVFVQAASTVWLAPHTEHIRHEASSSFIVGCE